MSQIKFNSEKKVTERNLERDQLTPVLLSSKYYLENHKDLLIFP